MAHRTDISTNFASRLRSVLAVGLLVAVAIYSLAPAAAHEIPRNRRPDTGTRPVIIPPRLHMDIPRTAIDAARDARLAKEAANARAAKKWEKRRDGMGDSLPHRDWETKKYWFRGTDHTFYSEDSAREAWAVTVDVYDVLSRGDVKGAKKIWKKAKKDAETLWHGRQDGEPRRDIRYGDDKDGKAHGKADEGAQNDILDGLWHDIKSAEASGLKPVKASAPSPSN